MPENTWLELYARNKEAIEAIDLYLEDLRKYRDWQKKDRPWRRDGLPIGQVAERLKGIRRHLSGEE